MSIKQFTLPQLQTLFYSLPDLYLILQPDLTIIDGSDAFFKATMQQRDKLIGVNLFTAFPEDPNDPHATGEKNFRESAARVLKYKKTDSMAVQKYNIRRPEEEGGDYEERYWSPMNIPLLDKQGNVEFILHRVEDVTEFIKLQEKANQNKKITDDLRSHSTQMEREIYRRAQEIQATNKQLQAANEELARSEFAKSKLAAVVEFTEEAIIGMNVNGIIQSWNLAAEKLYGYTPEEALGQSFSIIFPPDKASDLSRIMEEIRQGHHLRFLETERLHKNGGIIPVSVSVSPIKSKLGNVIGACSIARDITEWKQIEKMKNEFISVVSHELRTPLTSIQGSLSLMASGAAGEVPEKAKQLLSIGKQNCERLIRLINDILDVEKIESGKIQFKLQPVNMAQIVHEAMVSNQGFADKFNIKFKLIQLEAGIVNADRDRLLQILTNLLSNAVKFSYENSEVIIQLSTHDNLMRVAITNQGLGIPKDFQSRIFQKFSQANNQSTRVGSGTGLGLSITKEIIERLNGQVGFTSEPNKETTFYFDLPLIEQFPKIQSFEKIPTVLICEDDKEILNHLKDILEENKFKVIISETVQDARARLAENTIDALILDLSLPDEQGINLIKEIRKSAEHTDLPIVLVSISDEKSKDQIKGSSVTILDWIEKPVDLNLFVNALHLIKQKVAGKTPNILHIEDDLDLLQVIANLLQEKANVTGVTSLHQAKEELAQHNYDLVILDLMLPDGSGLEVLPIISKKKIPIIVFSAYEVPKDYIFYVTKNLLKTKLSPVEFVETIRASLYKKEEVT